MTTMTNMSTCRSCGMRQQQDDYRASYLQFQNEGKIRVSNIDTCIHQWLYGYISTGHTLLRTETHTHPTLTSPINIKQ